MAKARRPIVYSRTPDQIAAARDLDITTHPAISHPSPAQVVAMSTLPLSTSYTPGEIANATRHVAPARPPTP